MSAASIRIYMGVIILGANTLYIIFCLFKQIPMASKGLIFTVPSFSKNYYCHRVIIIEAEEIGINGQNKLALFR